jgi:hypothetical protein
VTFVYLHAGTPFAKKGEMQMTLPRMDLPVGIVEWEVFVPDTYSVRAFDGNVIDRRSVDVGFVSTSGMASGVGSGIGAGSAGGVSGGVVPGVFRSAVMAAMGEIRGRATDSTGAVLPGVTIVLEPAASGSTGDGRRVASLRSGDDHTTGRFRHGWDVRVRSAAQEARRDACRVV